MVDLPKNWNSSEVLVPGMLAHRVRDQILAYLATTYNIRDEQFRKDLEDFLISSNGIFKGPYFDIKLPFRTVGTETSMPIEVVGSFLPYLHQLRAWQRLTTRSGTPKSTLVSTGTGSGKTECFLFPILDHVMTRSRSTGVLAILFYPMNALAFDQARRLAKIISGDSRLKGIRVGLIAGEDPDATDVRSGSKAMSPSAVIDDRSSLIKDPPHILLTNYKMMDVMLQSPDFAPFWARMEQQQKDDRLAYLVFDEMHTYDGAQGADVAFLVRRLKARLGIPLGNLICVGTSATLSSSNDAKDKLLTFAKRLFGEEFDIDAVITEDRQSIEEVFAGVKTTSIAIPPNGIEHEHQIGESIPDLVMRFQGLWLNQEVTNGKELSPHLMSHPMTRELLKALAGSPTDESTILTKLREAGYPVYSGQLNSYLALLAQARRIVTAQNGSSAKAELPLFHVRVQLWMRELTSILVRMAGPGAPVVWNVPQRLSTQLHGLYLPPVFCEECGLAGFIAKDSRTGGYLEMKDLRAIANARQERAASTRYLFPWSGEPPELSEGCGLSRAIVLCDSCGTEQTNSQGESCQRCAGILKTMLVYVALTQQQGNRPQRDRRRCPACSVDGSLRSLSARLNTLTSISTSEIFLSRLSPPVGKRLLVFADSVQDASHRAGYLNARTYRFSVRTAIQSMLTQSAESVVPMNSVGSNLLHYWSSQLGQDKAIGILTPLDLMSTIEFQAYWKGDRTGLESLLERRLPWEVYLEFCLRGQVGRTLEKTLCSVPHWSHQYESRLLKKAFDIVVNEEGQGAIQDAGFESFCRFWRGVVRRMLHKGAISLPFVFSKYRAEGNSYLLSKRFHPWIGSLPSGRVTEGMEVGQLPNFPSTNRSSRIFDFIGASDQGRSWYHDWLMKHLKQNVQLSPHDITASLQGIFSALAKSHLLDPMTESRGSAVNYGLNPDNLFVHRDPILLKCNVCQDAVRVSSSLQDIFVESRCRMMRCVGLYRIEKAKESLEFYRNLYGRGQISRIFATEHTGILGRKEREEIETTFKADDSTRRPVDVNLLSCTSTLEMGIDIGDLGATVAAGLPRSAANYQQRIGRAGRSTGSAFIAAIAQSRPRDLLYFDEPEELVAGLIDPPGCYLDAPDILRRQFAAYIFETFGAELRGKRKKLSIAAVVEDLNSVGDLGFWKKLSTLLGSEADKHLGKFRLACHRSDIPDDTWGKVKVEWLTPDPQSDKCKLLSKLEGLIADFGRQNEELSREAETLKSRIVELESIEHRTPEVKAELEDTQRFAWTIQADLEAIGARGESLHGFLVRKGYLPNYAFGEDDVELIAYRRLRQPIDGQTFEQMRFVRSAATAIRDFALGNTFYGGGQRVEVNTLDLGKDSKRHVEDWRYCPDCAHLDRNREEETGKRCPSCGSPNWGDAGSRVHMVKLKRVKSVLGQEGSGVGDESESRQSEFYKTRKFFDGHSATVWGVNDEDLTVGVEFVPHISMREINFGFSDLRFQQHLTITGEELPSGFTICHSCGRLSGQNGEIPHTQTCPRNPRTPRVERNRVGGRNPPTVNTPDAPLLLYRELESEAVRIHVPVRAFNSAEKMASYQAALLLGLKSHFGGLPTHLVVEKEQTINVDDGLPQHALVIFDSVPGGSGFMKSLTSKDSFFVLVEKSIEALKNCRCAVDPDRDGCIRCVYGVVSQRDIPIVSRRVALDFLTRVIERKDDFEDSTVTSLRQRRCTESELEEILADIFDNCASDPAIIRRLNAMNIEVKQATSSLGKNGEGTIILEDKLTNLRSIWRIKLQRTIKERSEKLHTVPDFFLTKVGEDAEKVQPIALYCDGFLHHASTKSGDRLVDDFEKRSALSLRKAGEAVRVWNLEWDATKAFRDGDSTKEIAWFGVEPGGVDGLFKRDPVSLLFCILARSTMNAGGGFTCVEVNEELQSLVAAFDKKLRYPVSDIPLHFLSMLAHNRVTIDQSKPALGLKNQNALFAILANSNLQGARFGAMLWDCSQLDRTSQEFEKKWRQFLYTHNVLGMLTGGVMAQVVLPNLQN